MRGLPLPRSADRRPPGLDVPVVPVGLEHRRNDLGHGPSVVERRSELGHGDAPRTPSRRLALAEHSRRKVPPGFTTPARLAAYTGRSWSSNTWNKPQSSAESNVRPSPSRANTSATRNSARSKPRSRALSIALPIARGDASMPSTASPFRAIARAFSPVPHPASSAGPSNRPAATSASTSRWGRPMSQGGTPR